MIIDGKKQAEIIRDEIKKEISDLKKKSGKSPSLTVISVSYTHLTLPTIVRV